MLQIGPRVPPSPRISICILVVLETSMLNGCLESLRNNIPPSEPVEKVVVANGTPLSSVEQIRGLEDVVLVRSGTNLGFAGGNNLAAEIARAQQHLVFLNDDSIVEPGWLEGLTSRMDTSPSIGAVGSRIVSPAGALREAGSIIWRDGSTTSVGQTMPAGTPEYQYVRDVDFCSANGLMVRRRAWEEVGGFDERYFPAYQEDADLCMALRSRGYRVVYEPRARLCHLESQSTGLEFREFLYERHRRLFAAKWAAELRSHDEAPSSLEDLVAIEHAVDRARGAPPVALLVVQEPPDPCGDEPAARAMEAVEGLCGAGCAPVLTSRSPGLWKHLRTHPSILERLAGLGVDIQPDTPEAVLSRQSRPFDLVVLSGDESLVQLAPLARRLFPKAPLVLDVRAQEAPPSPDAARAVDHVVVGWEVDASTLRELLGEDSVTVVAALPTASAPSPGYSARSGILHVARWGSDREDDEIEALRFLVEGVLPHVVEQIPWVRVSVAGDSPPPRAFEFEGPNVELAWTSRSASSAFDLAAVAVVPDPYLPRPKRVLSALLGGLPTVAHERASKGLDLEEAGGLVVGTDPVAIATGLLELLEDPRHWEELHLGACALGRRYRSRPSGAWGSVLEVVGVRRAC